MNWSAIGSIGEVVGAVAVMASLIYLAIQVRSGSKTLSSTMRESTFNNLIDWNKTIMSEPDLAWIFQEGCRDMNSLDEKQKARFVHVMYSFFKLFESIFLHYKEKLVTEEIWDNNRLVFVAYITQPGAKHYWSSRRQIFDSRFRKIVDEICGPTIPDEELIADMNIPGIVKD